MRDQNTGSYLVNFADQINCFEICSSNFALNLICVAFSKKFTLGVVRFPEENEDGLFRWEHLRDIYNESRCHCVSFASSTTLMAIQKSVTFCAAGDDFILRIFRTDLQDSDTIQTLKGHKNYINDCSWDTNSECLASVSDDQSCKIWSSEANYENIITFCLSSAGMSVKWHPDEPQKIMVAEKKGTIHMYNVRSQQSIISVECPKSPLMSADWALNNCQYISALAGGEIVTWNLARRLFSPYNVKKVHEDGGRCLRFAPSSEDVVASIGRPDVTLKIFNINSTIPLLEASLKLYAGLAWHHRLSYLAAAHDRKLYFWRVHIK